MAHVTRARYGSPPWTAKREARPVVPGRGSSAEDLRVGRRCWSWRRFVSELHTRHQTSDSFAEWPRFAAGVELQLEPDFRRLVYRVCVCCDTEPLRKLAVVKERHINFHDFTRRNMSGICRVNVCVLLAHVVLQVDVHRMAQM